ncbi:unnamed protein product [Ilex paraguariensis]|uniref:Uncharacterized protein n=1 Tax=Ilex paraguariensis TaxID=185542 RepID=A0ABC8U427_9AQUA
MDDAKRFDAKKLLKDKKLWVASFLIAWAAALQLFEKLLWFGKGKSTEMRSALLILESAKPGDSINKSSIKE